MSKIDETLKKIAAGSSKENTPNSSSTEPSRSTRSNDLPGDPDCPICHGIGFVRLDVPIGDPNFGKLHLCTCRQAQVSQQVRQRLFSMSNLDELGHLTLENFQPRGRIGLSPYKADS